MEPSGCNRWQSVANETDLKTASDNEDRCRGLRPVASDVPLRPWVQGASPAEGVNLLRVRARPRRRAWTSSGSLITPATLRR
jgi:hypothetical protein